MVFRRCRRTRPNGWRGTRRPRSSTRRKHGQSGKPIYEGLAVTTVDVAVDWASKGTATLPSVVLLHYTNLPGKRMEVVDVSKGASGPSARL